VFPIVKIINKYYIKNKILNNINKSTMPLLRMNLTTQNQSAYNQRQYMQQIQAQAQPQPLFRLGSASNRNMLPLLVTGNKSCQSCGGK
jgi:hypothetical protein